VTSPIRAYPAQYNVLSGTWVTPENVVNVEDNNCAVHTRSGTYTHQIAVSSFDFSSLPDDAIIDDIVIAIKGRAYTYVSAFGYVSFWLARNSDGWQVSVYGSQGTAYTCAQTFFISTSEGAWLTAAQLKGEQYTAWVQHENVGIQTDEGIIDAVYIEVSYHLPAPAGGGAVGDALTWVVSACKRKLPKIFKQLRSTILLSRLRNVKISNCSNR
jgi:hypothetical protein